VPTRRTLAIAALAALSGCANKYDAVTPDIQSAMLADLQAGKLNLDCGEKCRFTWGAQVPKIHVLDISERWTDLAVRVMQIGYGSDLAYYYLGQAAQGLGHQKAAIAYYTYSLGLSTGPNALVKCEAGRTPDVDPCAGVDLVESIPVLIQASRDQLAREAAASQAPRRKKVVQVKNQSAGPAWVAPPPPAADAPAAGPGWAAPPPPAP
jgi:hypothetical protein